MESAGGEVGKVDKKKKKKGERERERESKWVEAKQRNGRKKNEMRRERGQKKTGLRQLKCVCRVLSETDNSLHSHHPIFFHHYQLSLSDMFHTYPTPLRFPAITISHFSQNHISSPYVTPH